MKELDWIKDEVFNEEVDKLLTLAQDTIRSKEKNFHKNVVDPFSSIFQISGFNLPLEEWKKRELTRQSTATLQGAIGMFHQRITLSFLTLLHPSYIHVIM